MKSRRGRSCTAVWPCGLRGGLGSRCSPPHQGRWLPGELGAQKGQALTKVLTGALWGLLWEGHMGPGWRLED